MHVAQWELLLEASTFTATAAAVGFAVIRCRSVLQALCAVPIAVFVTLLIPSRWGIWFSEYFQSVIVNVVAVGVLFGSAGALAGWSVSRYFSYRTSRA
jgi:vancomycin permeability regulator SanA